MWGSRRIAARYEKLGAGGRSGQDGRLAEGVASTFSAKVSNFSVA
jgi:hypothetical protein